MNAICPFGQPSPLHRNWTLHRNEQIIHCCRVEGGAKKCHSWDTPIASQFWPVTCWWLQATLWSDRPPKNVWELPSSPRWRAVWGLRRSPQAIFWKTDQIVENDDSVWMSNSRNDIHDWASKSVFVVWWFDDFHDFLRVQWFIITSQHVTLVMLIPWHPGQTFTENFALLRSRNRWLRLYIGILHELSQPMVGIPIPMKSQSSIMGCSRVFFLVVSAMFQLFTRKIGQDIYFRKMWLKLWRLKDFFRVGLLR